MAHIAARNVLQIGATAAVAPGESAGLFEAGIDPPVFLLRINQGVRHLQMLIGALPTQVGLDHAFGSESSEEFLVHAWLALGIHRLDTDHLERLEQLL